MKGGAPVAGSRAARRASGVEGRPLFASVGIVRPDLLDARPALRRKLGHELAKVVLVDLGNRDLVGRMGPRSVVDRDSLQVRRLAEGESDRCVDRGLVLSREVAPYGHRL